MICVERLPLTFLIVWDRTWTSSTTSTVSCDIISALRYQKSMFCRSKVKWSLNNTYCHILDTGTQNASVLVFLVLLEGMNLKVNMLLKYFDHSQFIWSRNTWSKNYDSSLILFTTWNPVLSLAKQAPYSWESTSLGWLISWWSVLNFRSRFPDVWTKFQVYWCWTLMWSVAFSS